MRGVAQRFAYLGLVVAAFALMLLGKIDTVLVERVRTHTTDALAPIMDVASRPLDAVHDGVEEADALLDIRAENARLREQNAQLLRWQAVARKLEAENRELRALMNVKDERAASYITARVIADTGGTFAHSLILNAGSSDGVRKGQAVMTGEGLVGRVQETGARSARLLLLTDLNSRIPVLVEPSRVRAVLAGTNTERPRLIHLPPGAVVSPGERIVTSGHAGAFPPGVPVGTIATVSDGAIGVQPFVNRARLEYVSVLDYGLDGIIAAPNTQVERR
jgi:rod shape-determining protein MreC